MTNPQMAAQHAGTPGMAAVHPLAWMHAQERSEAKRFWKYAPLVGLVMLALVTARLHEFVGPLRFVKPTFTFGVLGVGYLIVRSSNTARKAALRYLPLRLLIAYTVWIALLTPFAIWPGRAFVTVQGIIPSLLLVTALALCPPTKETADKVLWYFLLMVMVVTVAAFRLSTTEDGRFAIGGSYDPNDTAALLAAVIPFAFGVIIRNRGKKRWIAIAGVLLILSALAATQSRGGLIALVVGCFVYGWGFKASKRMMMIAGMVVLGIIGWTFTGDEFRERMGTLLELREDYNFQTYDGRIAIWKRGVGYTLENPILGVGPENFGFRDGQWLAQHGMTGKWSTAHNAYVQAFADLGFPGGLMFVAMLLVASRRAYEHWRPKRNRQKNGYHRPEYLASLVTIIVAAIFLSFAYSPVVFGFLGIAALGDRARAANDRWFRSARRMSMAAAQSQQAALGDYAIAVPFSGADASGRGRPLGGTGSTGG